jgi:hypothetical protein
MKNWPQLNRTHILAISQGTFESVDSFNVTELDTNSSAPDSGSDWYMEGWQQSLDPSLVPSEPIMPSQQVPIRDDDQLLQGKDINWARVIKYLSQNKPSRLHDILPDRSLVESLICATINGDQIPCSVLARVPSVQAVSKCETLFHESVLWDSNDPRVVELERHIRRHPTIEKFGSEEYASQEYLEFDEAEEQREAMEEQLEEQQHEDRLRTEMSNMEVIRMRLRFEADDYANPRALVGARLAIHSGSQVGSITHQVYQLEPGNWYTYYIDRYDHIRLPPPYNTRCYDYDLNRNNWRQRADWLRKSRERIHQLIRRQAKSDKPIKDYAEALRMRSMGKVSIECHWLQLQSTKEIHRVSVSVLRNKFAFVKISKVTSS